MLKSEIQSFKNKLKKLKKNSFMSEHSSLIKRNIEYWVKR